VPPTNLHQLFLILVSDLEWIDLSEPQHFGSSGKKQTPFWFLPNLGYSTIGNSKKNKRGKFSGRITPLTKERSKGV